MDTHISVNSSVCNHLHIYIYIARHELLLMSPTSIHYPMDHSSFLPLLIWIPLIPTGRSWCPSSIYFAGLFQDICLVVSELLIHEKVETVADFIFLGSKITADTDCSHEIKRYLFFGRKADKSRQYIKKQRHHLADKGPYSQNYGFSSSHVWVWELDHKEGWVAKNWCF